MRIFVLAVVLALGAGAALFTFAAWAAIQAFTWALDHAGMLLAEPLVDALRVLANI